MASPAYEQILEVQSLDLRLAQLRHKHATHPARADVETAEAEVARIDAVLAEVGEREHELERTQKRLSDTVETIVAKRQEIDDKLYGGAITSSKELVALQDEASSMLDRQRGVEDEQLEVMERLEEVATEIDQVQAELQAATAVKQKAETILAEATAELDQQVEELQRERADAAGPANPELLARYEELSPQFDGVPLARFVDGRCDGCHIQLSAVAADQLSRAPDDEVVTCEECGRLLVR